MPVSSFVERPPLAKAAATRAVEVDPMLGEAHFVLAQTLEFYDWNWSEAERQYKLALKLSPKLRARPRRVRPLSAVRIRAKRRIPETNGLRCRIGPEAP